MFFDCIDPLIQIGDEFPPEDFIQLGIPGYAIPKMHSSLPYVNGAVKESFNHPQDLLKHWVYKAFLYQTTLGMKKPLTGTIVLFTYVIGGGLGDWTTQIAASDILAKEFPHLTIHLVTLVTHSETLSFTSSNGNVHLFKYKDVERVVFSDEVMNIMKNASLIIQIPTFYPYWDELISRLGHNRTITIGEYGFIDSDWCHPKTSGICMGLHSLEKGLLFHEEAPAKGSESSREFFAYLYSQRGYATYLHALLTYLKEESFDVKLHASNLLLLLQAIQAEDYTKYGLAEITIIDGEHITKVQVGEGGKRLVIYNARALPHKKLESLMRRCNPFVGCRGDRSFTESVLADKIFFYDPPTHAIPFLLDLIDIANRYLASYPTLTEYLKTLVNQASSSKDLGFRIGTLLKDPSLCIGIQRLNKLLREEFTFNPTLCHLIYHQLSPQAPEHLKKLDLFLQKKISLKDFMLL